MSDISELIGKTLISVQQVETGDGDQIHFTTTEGREYRMYHSQDCCETVNVEDIVGDLSDLIGSPILEAEEASDHGEGGEHGESWTWTFYKLGTIKGHVNIRWLGSSNGYYSEAVDFVAVAA